MDPTLERIRKRMREEGEKTLAFFRSLDPTAWEQQVYQTGSGWRVREVLAHFLSSERGFQQILDDVLRGGQGAPRDLDIDTYNESEVPAYADASPQDLLEGFQAARQDTVDRLAALSPEDLARVGYHPWFGEVPLKQMLKLIYRHNMIHLRDVRRALETGAPVPHREVEPPSAGG